MRILYISNEYPPETGVGGIGTYTCAMARAMAVRGHEVHVICRCADGAARDFDDGGVSVHRIAPGSHPLPESPAWYPLRRRARILAPNLLDRLAWARAVRSACQHLYALGVCFDIVEYPECGGEGFSVSAMPIAATTVARLHTPWCMVREFDQIHEPFFDRMLIEYIERRSARNAHAVSSPSLALARLLEKRWRLRPTRVYPNPLDMPAFSLAGGGADWIYVGRIERRKGVDILLNAYAMLTDNPKLPRLRLIGRPFPADGEYARAIAARIKDPRFAGRIEWIQGVPPDRVLDYLKDACVAIVPSLWDNLPYACLEAMASGLAVVAARCGGLEEVITPNETGLLFEPGNVEELAGLLGRLVDEPQLASHLGMRARETVARTCNSAAIAAIAEAWYNHVITSAKKRN